MFVVLTIKWITRGGDNRDHFGDVEENEIYAIATLLDPRFKRTGFSSETLAECAEELLKIKVDEVNIKFDNSNFY